MIFKPESIALILSGAKTQTRRPVKAFEVAMLLDVPGYCYAHDRLPEHPKAQIDAVTTDAGVLRRKWEVGKSYAVCPGRGKRAVCRIRITDIRRERVCDITEADAEAEGIVEGLCGEGPHMYTYGSRTFTDFSRRAAYSRLWESLYPKSDGDELCWVLTFKLVGEEK